MSHFDHYFWQLKELQSIMDQMRPQLLALESIPNAVKEQMAQLASIRDSFALPNDYLKEVARLREMIALNMPSTVEEQVAKMVCGRDSLALPEDYLVGEVARLREIVENSQICQLKALAGSRSEALREILQRQHELDDWTRRLTESAQICLPTQSVVLDSLLTTEALLETRRLQEELLVSALQPQIAYQEFSRQQLELAAAASDVVRRNRLIMVDAAAELLEDMNKGFELSMLMNPGPSAAYSVSLPPVNVYTELTIELDEFDLEKSEDDIESAVLESKAGQITQLGAQLVRLVYNLNAEAEREGKPAIFKPTNKTLYSCSVIPTQVVTDDRSFADIIDHLYFLLYEGSGYANRLTARCSAKTLEALWKLKDLRTGARHDVDHGTGKEIEKKNHRTGEAYKSLIGAVAPRSRPDWLQAQISLYNQLVEMLEAVWFGDDTGEGEEAD